jgi:signal transduction histidine kinase
VTLSWPAIGSLFSGVLSVFLIRFLWTYRDDLPARLFIGVIACEALWALSYGVALFVFDPALRWLFEIPIWLGINFIGVFFLAFALEYTGRGALVSSRWFGLLVAVQTLHTAIVATNPLHNIAWSNYHVAPVFESATVLYTHQPWLFLNLGGLFFVVAAGVFLLLETFLSYGPLYRAQTVAVALSPIPVLVTILVWVFQVGPVAQLHLTVLVFPIHLGLDMYAFFRRDMFELTPAARRAGERAALDDLGTPVVIVDDDRRIINLNDEVRSLFDLESSRVLGRWFDDVFEAVDFSGDEQTVTITTADDRREYAITTSAIADSAGNHVGYTIAYQDITAEKRREQRLAVLNRVLRHNLRNDLNVVQGYLDVAGNRVDDDDIRDLLDTATAKADGLIELGQKAQAVDELMQADEHGSEAVPIRELLDELVATLTADDPGAEVHVDVPDGLRIRANRRLLRDAFSNLVENALEHDDAEERLVEVVLVETDGDDRTATFEIRDDGPGIPEHELTVLDKDQETALEHGSGLGLWVVTWAVEWLGGEIAFETTSDEGTTVVLELPGVVENEARGAANQAAERDAEGTPRTTER